MSEIQDDKQTEEIINIGSIDVPIWLYESFYQESARLLESLQQEINRTESIVVSKDLLRICHTLGSISRTLGFSYVADIGYAIEEWLTLLYEDGISSIENGGSGILPKDSQDLFLLATNSLSVQIESIRNKKIPEKFDEILLRLTDQILAHEMKEDPIADIPVSYTQKDDDSLAMDDNLHGLTREQIGFEEKTSVMDDWLSDLENLADATEQAVLMAEETHKIDVVTDQLDVSHPKASSADDARSTSLHVEDTVVVAQPDVVEPTVEVADIQVSYTQKDDDSLAMDDDLQGWMLESIGFEEKTSVMDDWLSDLENLADATEQAVLMAEETHKIDVVTDQSDVSHPKASSADDARSTSLHVEDTVVVAQPDVAVADVEMDAPEEVIRLSKQHLPDALASIAVPVSVMDDLNDDILSIFIDEASEIFSQIYSFVDGWKTDEGEASSESKKLLKRALHTLKGSSRMAGCMRFGSFIHNMEHIMEVGESVSGISFGDLPDLISMACDVAAQEVEYIQNYESAFVRNSSVAADKPVQAIESNRVELAPEANKEKIVAVIPQKEISSAAANMSSHSSVSNTIRVPIERMEKMSMCLAQTGMIHQRVVAGLGRSRLSLNDLTDNLDRLRRLVSEVEIQAEIQMQSRKEMMGSDFDPLEFDRFTRLQELTRMVTESIHDISMVQGNMEKGLVDTVDAVEEQNMVTDDLRYEVMHSRLLPIQSLTMRMERVVRQACRDSGKQADLIINGEVEIDSGVLNSVIAPLEHLIRNAVAHGVESPEKRKAQGKNERGIIILQVTQHGNEIHIELSDDGAGINRQAVEKKARERGLLANGDSLTQERANEMIFSSGFSTSESVTQLSGRGVGMDVVRGEVIKMGGWIQVSSMEGEGTSFHITIPSYMAIMSLAPVHSNGVEYCIPTSLVKDVRIAPQDELKAAYATGSIVFDGVNVPLYNFDRIMSVKNDVNLVRNNIIMLLEEYGKLMAFHIDMVGPDVNLVVRPLHKSVAAIPGIIGASVGGDGNPLWIVNPIRMNHPEESRVINFNAVASVNKQTYERVSGKTVEQILVMVVDDSLTVRKVTDKFLTREGYKVVTAKDGMDALEKLQEVQPDIFLLDIEMPRMDGFELAATLNSMEKTRDIPIIMISSRNIEKHQDHAKSLGVKEYLGKPYKENELLFHIQNLTQHEATHMISLND